MNEISRLKFSLKTPQGVDSLLDLDAYNITADLITGKEYIAPGHASLASVLYDFGLVAVKLKQTPATESLQSNLFEKNQNDNDKSSKILLYLFENAAFQVSTEIDTNTNLKYTNVLVAPYSTYFWDLSFIKNIDQYLEELKKKNDYGSNPYQIISFKSGKKINFSLNKEMKAEFAINKVREVLQSSQYLKYQ